MSGSDRIRIRNTAAQLMQGVFFRSGLLTVNDARVKNYKFAHFCVREIASGIQFYGVSLIHGERKMCEIIRLSNTTITSKDIKLRNSHKFSAEFGQIRGTGYTSGAPYFENL
jgi:hypothetical protein